MPNQGRRKTRDETTQSQCRRRLKNYSDPRTWHRESSPWSGQNSPPLRLAYARQHVRYQVEDIPIDFMLDRDDPGGMCEHVPTLQFLGKYGMDVSWNDLGIFAPLDHVYLT